MVLRCPTGVPRQPRRLRKSWPATPRRPHITLASDVGGLLGTSVGGQVGADAGAPEDGAGAIPGAAVGVVAGNIFGSVVGAMAGDKVVGLLESEGF